MFWLDSFSFLPYNISIKILAFNNHQYYDNKHTEINQIKNKGSPLLAGPFGAKIKNSNLRLKSDGEPSQRASQQKHFLTGGVLSKKFELISPKICRTGGIPPKPPFRPPAEETLSDWTISSFSFRF